MAISFSALSPSQMVRLTSSEGQNFRIPERVAYAYLSDFLVKKFVMRQRHFEFESNDTMQNNITRYLLLKLGLVAIHHFHLTL